MSHRAREADDAAAWFRVLAEVLNRLGIGLLVGNPERAIVANEAFCAMTGSSESELLAMQSPVEIVAPEVRTLLAERARRRGAGGDEPPRYETEILHRD